MCDYSLHSVSSRPARVGDKLVTTEFAGSNTRGFAALGEHGAKLVIHDGPPKVAVCLLPGTELAFDDAARCDGAFSLFGNGRVNHKVARFRQIDMGDPHVSHDALEFPDGKVVKVTRLVAGQTATVLQLPVAKQQLEPVATGHHAGASNSRLALNRVPLRPGMTSMLMPNQGAAMLWQMLRSTAIELSIDFVQSFHRLKAHKQPAIPTAASPARIDAEKIAASSEEHALTVTLPKKPTAPTPEKKIEATAA